MIELTFSEAAQLAQGHCDAPDGRFRGLSTDSRSVSAGELFVALRGPTFDGHRFVSAAAAAGAVAALSDRADAALPCIVVDDALAGLGRLAAAWRDRFDVDTVGITGSNGKTTVKEMVAAILAQDAPVLATRGNLNNNIGVPLTLARLAPSHTRLVVEMGANHPGEIAGLAKLARPRIGVITLIAPAHLEGFGSVEGVARAKGELFAALPADGVAVVNADDPRYLPLFDDLAGETPLLRFGFADEADIRVEHAARDDLSEVALHTPTGSTSLTLQLAGRHNARNAAAAAAVAVAMGVSLDCVQAGLEGMRAVRGRLVVHRTPGGGRVLDDSYNANPHSLAAALEVLGDCPGPRWVALGDMAELGADAERFHREAGVAARTHGVDRLLTIGPLAGIAAEAFGHGSEHFADRDALCGALEEAVDAGATVLVKGSRSAGMEHVVRALLKGESECS